MLNKKNIILIDCFFAIILLLLYYSKDWVFNIIPSCIFKRLTGFYCISCGGTRTIKFLLNFDFQNALRENILIVFVCLVFIVFLITYNISVLFENVKTRDLLDNVFSLKIIIYIIIMALIFMIIRNIPYYPFELLAPI